MIDLLLVNPNEHAEEIVRVLSTNNISYLIVTTNGNMFAYQSDLKVLNMNQEPWVKDETFKLGIGWGAKGFSFLKGVTELGQIVLKNNFVDTLITHYQADQVKENLSRMYNIVSYKGVHIILDAYVLKDGAWTGMVDHRAPYYYDGVTVAKKFLSDNGVLNGLSQVFVDQSNNTTFRMNYRSLTSKISKRNVVDVLNKIIFNDEDYIDQLLVWAEATGRSSSSFHLARGL